MQISGIIIEELRIRCFGPQHECNNLSGGNQQKVMSDLKKEVNDKVQLPEREDEFLLGEDFEEPDDNDSLLE